MNTAIFNSSYINLHQKVNNYNNFSSRSLLSYLLLETIKRVTITFNLAFTPLSLLLDVGRALVFPTPLICRVKIIGNSIIKHIALVVSFVAQSTFHFILFSGLGYLLIDKIPFVFTSAVFNPLAAGGLAAFLLIPHIYKVAAKYAEDQGTRDFSFLRRVTQSNPQCTPATHRIAPTSTSQNSDGLLTLIIRRELATLLRDNPLTHLNSVDIDEIKGSIRDSVRPENFNFEDPTIKKIVKIYVDGLVQAHFDDYPNPIVQSPPHIYSAVIDENKLERYYLTVFRRLEGKLDDRLKDIREDPSEVFTHLQLLNSLLVFEIFSNSETDPMTTLTRICAWSDADDKKTFTVNETSLLSELIHTFKRCKDKEEILTDLCNEQLNNEIVKKIHVIAGHFIQGYKKLSDILLSAAKQYQNG